MAVVSSRRKPRRVLARSIAVIAARRAGLSLDVYCRAVGAQSTDAALHKALDRALSDDRRLSMGSDLTDALSRHTNGAHEGEADDGSSSLHALGDAILRRPGTLVMALRAYRPRALMVRALRDHMPRGVLHGLVAIMAGRDTHTVTALLEAADLTPGLSLPTWTATLSVLIGLRSSGRLHPSALGRILENSAKRAALSIEDYLSQMRERDETGRIERVLSRMAQAWARAARTKAAEAKTPLQKASEQQSQQLVHRVLRALADAPSTIGEASIARDAFIETWSRMPAVVLVALRTYTPRSSIVRAIVRTVPRAVRDDIATTLAGRHAAAILDLTKCFDDDPTSVIPSWEAALSVLLRCETHRGTRRRLIDEIVGHAAYRSRVAIDVYQARLRSCSRSSSWIEGLGVEAPSIPARGDGIVDYPIAAKATTLSVRRDVSWAKQAIRLAKTRRRVDLFLHLLEHETIPPWHTAPGSMTPPALRSSLVKTTARPIALALSRRSSSAGIDQVHLDRLTRVDARRLLRSLSRRRWSLIVALVDVAERAIARRPKRRRDAPSVVALDIALRTTARAISPNRFGAAFVRRLAEILDVTDQTIITCMKDAVAMRSPVYRLLATVESSLTQQRRKERPLLLTTSFHQLRRRTIDAEHKKIDPLIDQRRIRVTDNDDLDQLLIKIADLGRRARRRAHGAGKRAVIDPATAPDPNTAPAAALVDYLWYGTVPVSVDESLSASLERRVGAAVAGIRGQRPPAGADGLVSRLRQLDDDPENRTASCPQDDTITIVLAAIESDTEPVFQSKAPSLRRPIGDALSHSEARMRFADAIDRGSPDVARRAALLLSASPRYRRSSRLMTRDAASRYACDLFSFIMARDALPWWHPISASPHDVLTTLIKNHRHAVARALIAKDGAPDDARRLVDRLGIGGTMPLIRALARRDFDLVEASIATSRAILRDDHARWTMALETLLALRGHVDPSSFIAGFSARSADRVGTDAEAIAATLAGKSTAHAPALARSLSAARAGLLVAHGERSGFFGDPVELGKDPDRVTLMWHHLRYGAPQTSIDTVVRDAFTQDSERAADIVRIAVAHPIPRGRVATVSKATLVLVLGAVCDGAPQRLRPLLEALSINPSSIDPVLAAIGGGQTRIEPLILLARPERREPITSVASPTRSRAATSFGPMAVEPGASILIDNAGLVILAPFLGRLFSGLGLLDDDKVLQIPAAQRAVHLLQYLANGETDALEHRLVLNKLLCGLDPAIPLIASIAMDGGETALADSLLRSVTQNWPPLKSSTIAGLRDTFLRRDGVLRETPDTWVLTVTPGPFDMLLDRLPWPLSVVRLRWMPKLLTVEWR